MIRINLLPPHERQPSWPLQRLFIMIGCIVSVLAVASYSYGVIYIWHTERQIVEARNQYELLRPTESVMSVANSKQQNIQAKNNIMVNLTKERKSWPPIITHLASLTTSRVWFTDLASIDKDTIKIIGLADNYQEVATFLQRIEQDSLLAEPSLVQAEVSSNPAAPATKFEITVKLKGMKQ